MSVRKGAGGAYFNMRFCRFDLAVGGNTDLEGENVAVLDDAGGEECVEFHGALELLPWEASTLLFWTQSKIGVFDVVDGGLV